MSVLREFSARKAFDDRDKVFLLLGLASDINTIESNYSRSRVQVYRNTVIDLIKHSRTLTALSGDMKRKNSGGIPTLDVDRRVVARLKPRATLAKKIADVGGQPNLFPRPRLDCIYSMTEIAKAMDMRSDKGSLIGAGAGPYHVIGQNCDLAPNLSWQGGLENIKNQRFEM